MMTLPVTTDAIGQNPPGALNAVQATASGRREREIARDFADQTDTAIRIAYHLIRDRDGALDIVQEAFVRALESGPNMNDAPHARAWFHRVVVNLCRDWLRRRGAERRALGEMEARSRSQESGGSLEEFLRESIFLLPPDLRECVVLVCIEGQTPKDAAQILNVPEGTLRWRLHEGRKRLKEAFSKMKG